MGKKRWTLILAILFLAVPQVTFCFLDQSMAQSTAMGVKIGQKAPEFTLKSMDGATVSLADYAGKKVVMLEFWATWCNICVAELPELIKVYNQYRNKGVEILGITLATGTTDDIREIMDKHKIPYPILLDEQLVVATKMYKLAGPIPLKVIIGADGIVKYAHVGDYPPGENELPYIFDDLIKEIPAAGAAPPAKK